MPGMDGTGPYGTGASGKGFGSSHGEVGKSRGADGALGTVGFSPTRRTPPLDERQYWNKRKLAGSPLKAILQRLQGLE